MFLIRAMKQIFSFGERWNVQSHSIGKQISVTLGSNIKKK